MEATRPIYHGPYVAMRDPRTNKVQLVPAKLVNGQWVALTAEETQAQAR